MQEHSHHASTDECNKYADNQEHKERGGAKEIVDRAGGDGLGDVLKAGYLFDGDHAEDNGENQRKHTYHSHGEDYEAKSFETARGIVKPLALQSP